MPRFICKAGILSVSLLALSACNHTGAGPTTHAGNTPSASAPAKPKITAAQLLGQVEPWVLGTLGEPDFKRADMTASLWQYKNSVCVLNVFLYGDEQVKSAPAKVLHFDARDATGHATSRDMCLSALQD